MRCRPPKAVNPSALANTPKGNGSNNRSTEKIEEETIAINRPEDYYPVYIGEVIKSRYQIVAKQGYGVGSTVWLCRDLIDNRHLTLKVCVRRTKQLSHELMVSEHLKKRHDGHHPGQKLVQVVLDSFEIDGPHGQHVCLLYEPLGMKLTELITHMPNGMIPADELQKITQIVLIALDHIHRQDVIHTDICMNNVLQTIEDKSIFTQIEEDEFYRPIRRKKLHDRHIYYSRSPPVSTGLPILCDFGGARLNGTEQEGDIMFSAYKPPEVILGMKWDHKVDIWGLGLMVWRMFEGVHLFPPRESNTLDEERHLAEMVSLLGPPPAEFLIRSPKYFKYWDDKGELLQFWHSPCYETSDNRAKEYGKA
ncbi:hypothetical protein PISL3812_08874 [Talaromyces islandicus]|uniref:non-specific serine/threonine protein kinase n=1 Tax=Talaromyces islandicus TaxID=28573 RepID=A0A0U1MA34_TALIS|nr:hypothetical protein PISL3812_08874 [Talaromyces islandicus]